MNEGPAALQRFNASPFASCRNGRAEIVSRLLCLRCRLPGLLQNTAPAHNAPTGLAALGSDLLFDALDPFTDLLDDFLAVSEAGGNREGQLDPFRHVTVGAEEELRPTSLQRASVLECFPTIESRPLVNALDEQVFHRIRRHVDRLLDDGGSILESHQRRRFAGPEVLKTTAKHVD